MISNEDMLKDVLLPMLNNSTSVVTMEAGKFPEKSYEWQPQEDITAYELSLCVIPLAAYIAGHDVEVDMIEALPESALRHFKVIE